MSANNSGHEDAAGKTHAASGARPITREDEGRVREAIHRAMLSVIEGREPPLLHFAPDGMLKTIESSEGFGLCAAELGALARAGIVPGPDGWRWAAPAPIAKGDRLCSRTTGRVYTARAFLSDFTRYPGGPLQGPGWKLEDEDEDGMPAWETVSDLNNTEKWERVGPRLAPTVILDAPSQPAGMGEQRAIAAAVAGAPEDRPSQLRTALLSVLSRGPVEGLARILPALDAAMGEAPGVARATGAEARRTAAEVGAVVDGARWSLPAMPPGWGWQKALSGVLYLAPHGSSNAIADSIANVSACNSIWTVTEPGADGTEIERGEGKDEADAKGQALLAARRAGLFARSMAAPVAPAPAEPVYPAPHGPLDAAVLAILATASPAEITAHLAAWGATLVEQARAPRHAIEAIGEQSGTVTARRTLDASGVLRVYADDGATVAHEERVGGEDSDDAIDPAWAELETRVERAERAAAEARLEAESAAAARDTLARDYAAERALSESLRAQLDEAETARDDARAALADLRAALADLAARWAGGAA